MRTLIIHPEDKSTDCLTDIYKTIPNKTVFRNELSKNELICSIAYHDRILFMGHGTPDGLIGFNKMYITSDFVDMIKPKQNSVFIWCNADRFVSNHNLTGFNTGMIISETSEAYYCRVYATQDDVDKSNYLFCNTIGKYINDISVDTTKKIIEEYDIPNNKVVEYNRKRIFYK